ncbi:MAG: GntR family transcriptional regulator [Alphaproteobacteria bacterium]|nr:GntR family transcriptional regulator [Alphaproteobacteria bacterium]MBU1278875.1 GntR family transcriptional regulator [Alphaproteobacteria bacterium]MBU1575454.1 GntR family transcriptional regulator [Alphaproteobacteria bacterium]MBU1829014.1 GntR family transcriptional regulator [Alphaproteobacteria bacterium]MBU2077475.1 GntR family transcriptional regulator [Alphaproteobacteria bacterium]
MDMMPEPLRARERAERIHADIRSRICMLDYPPGMKLSETALAAELGISRTPIRRVLARLEDEGLVTSVHGVGTMVTNVDYSEMSQVYRLRKELVLLQTVLDPVHPDATFLQRFRALYARSEALKAAPSARDFSLLDQDTFLTLLDLTANAPLRTMAERLYFRTARIWLQQVTGSQIDLMQEIDIYARELQDLLGALELGDLDAVGHIRRGHISMSFARMRV